MAEKYHERIVSAVEVAEQPMFTLRPQFLKDYVGQTAVCQQLALFIQAARSRQEALDHVMLYGPPGLGKTTLAHIIAHELGAALKRTTGPVLERPGDIAALLTNLQQGDVLFIDEIHRLTPAIEEALYPAMEDYHIDILLGEGPAARSIKLDIAPFTLVGATTRAGLLTSPLRDRFGILLHLEYYPVIDLAQIILRSALLLEVNITTDGANEIARRARGTPRIANRLLRRVRDYANMQAEQALSLPLVQAALDFLHVDEEGLDQVDRKLLLALLDQFNGGPVGLETLAAFINEAKETVEDVIEPFLLQQGFLLRTYRGRLAGRRAYRHFARAEPVAGGKRDDL